MFWKTVEIQYATCCCVQTARVGRRQHQESQEQAAIRRSWVQFSARRPAGLPNRIGEGKGFNYIEGMNKIMETLDNIG
jgi:hypothetical protein